MNLGKTVMPAESEAEIGSEEVRLRITEAPHDIENQKDPILEKLLSSNPPSSSRCIYRVPKRLQQGNEKAYTPQAVSIGPLHHGEEPLKAMEEHKLRYLGDFLNRTSKSVSFCDRFCDCIQMIKNQEENLRGFYADSIKFGSDEFVRIVLVDAAFVIELLLRNHYPELQVPDDYIFKNPEMLWDVRPDLRLLENQLPFFILRDLFNTLPLSPQLDPLLELSYHFFENEIDGGGKEENFAKILSSGEEVQHFVDLIRTLYLPLEPKKKPKAPWCNRILEPFSHSIFLTSGYTPNTTDTPKTTATPETTDKPNITATPETTDKPNITATPNVTELHQAGAKFKVGKGSSLLDIKFSRGTLKICGILEIPKLLVDDTTDVKLRNLLAFEQCHHKEEDYLANYVFLMKRLVKTPKDVELLVEKGIIENWLGDTQKISTLLHDLGTGMIVDEWYYAPLCKKLMEYRKVLWRRWMVILKQDYFNTPWAFMSVAAAVVLLGLTVVQTVYSIKSVP